MDAFGFKIEPTHDLTTPRGRLLYLRDVVVPGIPLGQLDMAVTDCGTHACLAGWAMRDKTLLKAGLDHLHWFEFYGLSGDQLEHLFEPDSYGGSYSRRTVPTHAELTQHIDDVLEGRVR